MNQRYQSDYRLSLRQRTQHLALALETGNYEKKIPPTQSSIFQSNSLFILALLACLSTGVVVAKKMAAPESRGRAGAESEVVELRSVVAIPDDRTPPIAPAALTPTRPSHGSKSNQIVIPTGFTPAADQTIAEILPLDEGESNPLADAAKPSKPSISKDAFFGEIFGVARVTIAFDDERSPVVPPDQPIGVTDRNNRTSYGVVTPRYRNEEDGDFHLTELTVQFLFRGSNPLDISLQASQGSILLDEHIQVENDQNQYHQLLGEWWAQYSQPRERCSSELFWMHRSVAEMLARRLDISLPVGWSKKLKPRSMAKVEQDFERILSTLLGIDSVLIAMGQDATSKNDTDVIADQRLPTAINIRPVRTTSVSRATKVEDISMRIPKECFYVRCRTLHNYEWLRSFVTHWNGSLDEIVKVSATDRGVRQRLEKQLALDLKSCKQLGLENEISDVALIGCDLNFDDGPAIGVVFESNDVQEVQRIIERQRTNALSSNPDAIQKWIDVHQRPVSFVQSPGNVIRSYSVNVDKYYLVTNSLFIVRRFIESSAGSGSLGRLNEFLMARQKVPSAGSNVVQIYLSDPFFRQVVSPKFRIEASRRQRAVEELKQLSLARAIASAEGVDGISVDELRELEYLSSQFNQRADNSAAQFVGQSVSDTSRGKWGTFKPIADMQLDRATRTEVSAYQRFSSQYQRQWRRMDPVVANLSVTPNGVKGTETVKLDVLVVPFARQRYDVLNRYLASATRREVDTLDDDLIAVTAGLRSPRGGTMLTRMGIQDEAIEYRIENGQVVTAGEHRGTTLARSNLYVLVDSAGTDGLRRLGEFVQSLQGNSPVPAKTPSRSSHHVVNLLLAIPRMFGSFAKAGSIDTQDNWTIMSPRKVLRERTTELASVQPSAGTAQVRFRMNDVNRSKASAYINAYTYLESRKVSSANTALLNYVGQKLPVVVDEAPEMIEQVLGIRLVCPLGREYRLADRREFRFWTASAEEMESYFDVSSVPEDYSFPFLDWLRGMELEFNLSGNTLTSNVRLTTKQTLPSQSQIVKLRQPPKQNPSGSSIAVDDTSIQPGGTVVVTVDSAQLRVKTDILAEARKGQCLQVLKVHDPWIWTYVDNKNGTRTHGWVNIRQVARHAGDWALVFDGSDDHGAAPNIALDNFAAFTLEAWVRDWKRGILCQGRAGDPENSLWMSTGTRANVGSPDESCGWENGAGTNYEIAVGRGIPGKWNHVAMVYDGKQQLVFLNGKLIRSRSVPKPGPLIRNRGFLLGAHEYGYHLTHGSGAMSSVRVSKVARYRTNFNPARLFCTDTDTVLLYKFDEAQGTILHDSSGYQRHATIKGAQWIKVDDVFEQANGPERVNGQLPFKPRVGLAEKYLHSGELAKGEQAMEAALVSAPDDDQVRFGLGVLQFVRGVERLGQSLHQYGAKSENTNIPFLRLPVPTNPDPALINYHAFRRVLDDFLRDLRTAEATLADVTDEDVVFPLRLADIRLDLDGDGKPTDRFIDILKKIMRQEFTFLKKNPEFLVNLDRGDVAWLRSYCHLLMGMLDGYLAFDTEQVFDLSADELFANPKNRFQGKDDSEKWRKTRDTWKEVALSEPARLGRFRRHLIKVTELNRETWKHIRAETDDDHEWLPNAKQTGVLGLPVRENMIDAWLAMMAEFEALLDGNRTFPKIYLGKAGKGLNLKQLFDEPPEKFVFDNNFPKNLPDKYFSNNKDVDINTLFRAFSLFENTTTVGYAAWFN